MSLLPLKCKFEGLSNNKTRLLIFSFCYYRTTKRQTRLNRRLFDETAPPVSIQEMEPLRPTITLPLRTLQTQQFVCVVCACNDMSRMIKLPDGFIGSLYRRDGIYVPKDSFICFKHLTGDYLSENDEDIVSRKTCAPNTQVFLQKSTFVFIIGSLLT